MRLSNQEIQEKLFEQGYTYEDIYFDIMDYVPPYYMRKALARLAKGAGIDIGEEE